MPPYQLPGEPQHGADVSDFVLEKVPQRLDQFVKGDRRRKPSHIVVAFDHCRGAFPAFDHVGINRALGQRVNVADLPGLVFEDADEFLPDDLPLPLRFADTRQFPEKARARVHPDEIHAESPAERVFHKISLILPEQTVVHKDADQALPDRLMQQKRGNIDTVTLEVE